MTRTPPPRGFTTQEYQSRADRLQRCMAAAAIDVLLLTTEADVRYVTGFDTRFWLSPTRPWFVLVPQTGAPTAVVPEIGAPAMARTWVDDIRTWPAPVPGDEGVTLLAEAIRDLTEGGSRVGVPMGAETHLRMPLADWARLGEALPEVSFVDATEIVAGVRMIKSLAEVAKIRYICQLTGDTFDAVPGFAQVGRPLSTVFREFRIDLLQRGADDVPYLVGGAGPGGYADVISPPTDTPLRDGDVLMLDTGAVFDGYFCDFDRNLAIGRADDDAHRAYETLDRAVEAGLAAAHPGARCCELFAAMHQVIEAAGWRGGNVGRFGHGLGTQLTEWPSHTATDTTVVQAGMVLTLEPSLAIAPGRTMVFEENLVVHADGPELLTRRAPAHLPVV